MTSYNDYETRKNATTLYSPTFLNYKINNFLCLKN